MIRHYYTANCVDTCKAQNKIQFIQTYRHIKIAICKIIIIVRGKQFGIHT